MVEIFDDIRKIYKFSSPCDEFRDYIEFFSESSEEKTSLYISERSFAVKMFQSWTPTIWINLGTPYRLSTLNKSYQISRSDDILLLRNTAVTRHVLRRDHIFTIKFFPGGLEALLGIKQPGLSDQIIRINSIIPREVLHTVRASDTFEKRIHLFQKYLLTQFKKNKQRDHYRKIVQDLMIEHKKGNFLLNTTQSAEKMFITSKTITRYFNNVVGIGPKKYFSTLRARTALTKYVTAGTGFDPTEFGYYDMSHFHKDIKTFTGQSLAASHQ